MKKYILIISAALALINLNSCSENELELLPPSADYAENINTEDKLQKMLNGAYYSIGSVSAYGNDLLVFGDILGDKIFNTPSRASFLQTSEYNYNPNQNQFGFYGTLYKTIVSSNIVINNTLVEESNVTKRIKGEAKILRALAYFTLVNYYSASPTSGVNQEYGVPLVLGDYDVLIQPARATVAEVYNQIIKDLTEGMSQTSNPATKVTLGADAAKLLLSKVYLTRRAAGDAQLALQYSTELINKAVASYAPNDPTSDPTNSKPNPFITSKDLPAANYNNYFRGQDDSYSENHPETIWELDINSLSNAVLGLGSNGALPVYYSLGDNTRRGLLANRTFYDSFGSATVIDVRRGPINTGLFSSQAVPSSDTPLGLWINKYPRATRARVETPPLESPPLVSFVRNIKILRFSEAYFNRMEALRLLGQEGLALTELNAFAASRKGLTYTNSTDLLTNILTEKSKEFYGEGQRFLDLKRYNLPVNRPSNCTTCELQATDKRFVLPLGQNAVNQNANLKQYPGY